MAVLACSTWRLNADYRAAISLEHSRTRLAPLRFGGCMESVSSARSRFCWRAIFHWKTLRSPAVSWTAVILPAHFRAALAFLQADGAACIAPDAYNSTP